MRVHCSTKIRKCGHVGRKGRYCIRQLVSEFFYILIGPPANESAVFLFVFVYAFPLPLLSNLTSRENLHFNFPGIFIKRQPRGWPVGLIAVPAGKVAPHGFLFHSKTSFRMSNHRKETPQQQLDRLLAQRADVPTDPLSCIEHVLNLVTLIHNVHCLDQDDRLGLWVVSEEARIWTEIAMLRCWIASEQKKA